MNSTIGLSMITALLAGAPLAACGGDLGRAVAPQTFHHALKGTACMRANSVKTCSARQKLQASETRSRIVFVHCVRTHGVRNFPYPSAAGHVSAEMVRAQGIDPQSPAVGRVVSECLPPWLRPPKAH
jgi:hypothetical protein